MMIGPLVSESSLGKERRDHQKRGGKEKKRATHTETREKYLLE
jgi:hypothetical protein